MARARLEATVGLRSGAFRRGMLRIRRVMAGFRRFAIGPIIELTRKLVILGAAAAVAAAGGMIFLIKKVTDFGDKIGKMSKRTGVSTDELQRLNQAAELAGTNIDTLEKGIKRMSGFLDDVANNLSTAKIALAGLGLELKDFQALGPGEVFNKFLKALAEIEDPLKRAALAQDVFGRAGTQLLPLLSDGVKGLEDMREEAERLGLIMTPEQIRNAEQFKDEMFRVKAILAAIGRGFAADFLPLLNSALQNLQNVLQGLRESQAFKDIGEGLRRGGAVLLAAAEIFVKLPNRLAFLRTLIVGSFEIGALLIKKAIVSAFDTIPFFKRAKERAGTGKALGRLAKGFPEVIGGLFGGGPKGATEARESISEDISKAINEATAPSATSVDKEIEAAKKKLRDAIDNRAKEFLGVESFEDLVETIFKKLGEKRPALKRAGAGAPGFEAPDVADTKFSSLRRIGANIIKGALPANIQKQQLSTLQKQLKEAKEQTQLLKERVERRGVF